MEEPEQWKEQQLSTLELFIQTHNKNPVERVSPKIIVFKALSLFLLSPAHSNADTISDIFNLFSIYLNLQRINDSLTICAEPDNFNVADFITVGFVVSVFYEPTANREHC